MIRTVAICAAILMTGACADVRSMTTQEIEQAGRNDPTLPGLFSGKDGELVILSR